jgi:uncharacterized protein (DUF1919 family)
MELTFISNTCSGYELFKLFNIQYNNPFIGSLFVNDVQYAKFCSKFDYYVSLKPVFKNPDTQSIWAKENKGVWYKHNAIKTPYPVMYLDDIEIHWIHETSAVNLLDKYNKRLERLTKRNIKIIMIFSESEFLNNNSFNNRTDIITTFFNSRYNTIFLGKTKLCDKIQLKSNNIYKFIQKWKNQDNIRLSSHILIFNNQPFICKVCEEIINDHLK